MRVAIQTVVLGRGRGALPVLEVSMTVNDKRPTDIAKAGCAIVTHVRSSEQYSFGGQDRNATSRQPRYLHLCSALGLVSRIGSCLDRSDCRINQAYV